MKRAVIRLLPLVASLWLTACFGPLPAPPPARVQTAIEFNNRAVTALTRADYPMAERLFLQAIDHEQAIENMDGIAINLIGLALTYQRAGKTDEALRIVQRLVEPQSPPLANGRQAEAALLGASLLISRADWPGAALLLKQAAAICDQPTCPLLGRLLNLKAQLAIVGNRLDEAALLAGQALKLATEAGDMEEEANALRTLANSRLFSRPEEAIPLIERALEIDKKLAISRKIVKDLILYGRLQQATRHNAAARQIYARARSVAQADQNSAGLQEISRLEQELKSGENDEK